MADSNKMDHAAHGQAKVDAHVNGDGSGFMQNAINGMRTFIGSGALGTAPLNAGDDAWRKFHGPGPSST